jgi:hypothetical protein
VPSLVFAPHQIELSLEPSVVGSSVLRIRLLLRRVVVLPPRARSSLDVPEVVVRVPRGVDAGRGRRLHRVQAAFALDPRQRKQVHLGRASRALLVLAHQTQRRAHAFLGSKLRLLLLVAARASVHALLQLSHLL